MNADKKPNLTMLCDFYELTMAKRLLPKRLCRIEITYFDRVFPEGARRTAALPLRRAWSRPYEYIQNLHFGEDDIAYLRTDAASSARIFSDYLNKLPLHGRHLGGAGGDADLPEASRS